VVRQCFPEIVYFVYLASCHNIVIDFADFGGGFLVFNQSSGIHRCWFLSLTNFNQIEIEKALTAKTPGIIFGCGMQDLNPAFIVKLGAIPQPILATVALMAELDNVGRIEDREQSANEAVDFEHMEREHPDWGRH
jgi:hypothetical protein